MRKRLSVVAIYFWISVAAFACSVITYLIFSNPDLGIIGFGQFLVVLISIMIGATLAALVFIGFMFVMSAFFYVDFRKFKDFLIIKIRGLWEP